MREMERVVAQHEMFTAWLRAVLGHEPAADSSATREGAAGEPAPVATTAGD